MGSNLVGQENWELRGANEARIRALEARSSSSPVGQLAYIPMTSTAAAAGGAADVAGLSATVTVPDGRRLRISAFCDTVTQVGAGASELQIWEGGTQLTAFQVASSATAANGGLASTVVSPSAGTHTYRVRTFTTATSVAVVAAASLPAYILVEDITGTPLSYSTATVPVGLLAQAPLSATQGSLTAAYPGTAISGLSVNVVVPAGRTLRVAAEGYHWNSTLGVQNGLHLLMDGTPIKNQYDRAINANQAEAITAEVFVSPTSGAHTFSVNFSVAAGSGTFGGEPAFLIVEDVTPTPAAGQGAPSSTLGYAEVTTGQSGITSAGADLTNLAVTVTVPAGRRIKITARGRVDNDGTAGEAICQIKEGSTELARWVDSSLVAGALVQGQGSVVLSPTAGTHTYKLTGIKNAAGSFTLTAFVGDPAFILVEDITGSVWPAGSPVTSGLIASEGWTDFVPTFTQNNVAVTKGSIRARYIKLGRLVIATVDFAATGVGTINTDLRFGLPVAAASTSATSLGTGRIFKASNFATYPSVVAISTATECVMIATVANGIQTQGSASAAYNFAVASGDGFAYQVTYEAAS